MICQIFNSCSSLVDIAAKKLASCILFLKQGPVLFHGFILAIAFPEHVKGFGPISQILQAALNGSINHSLGFFESAIETTLDIVRCSVGLGSLLVQLEVHPLFFDRLISHTVISLATAFPHHLLEQGRISSRLGRLFAFFHVV